MDQVVALNNIDYKNIGTPTTMSEKSLEFLHG